MTDLTQTDCLPLPAAEGAGEVFDLLDKTARAFGNDLVRPLAEHPRLCRLVLHVWTDLSQPLLCAKASEIVGVERKYFSKFFRREAGYNFSWWNREIRTRRAEHLLRQRGRTIHSIAFAVGYRDLTTFERAFKKSKGIGPREYRVLRAYTQKPRNDVPF